MFKAKHIDVDNAAEMKLVQLYQVHPDNPFMYRIECQRPSCRNQVWPSQMIDVRDLPVSLTDGVEFACDGCVETWIRQPEHPFTAKDLMQAHGASAADIKKWKAKNEAAKPKHKFIKEGEVV